MPELKGQTRKPEPNRCILELASAQDAATILYSPEDAQARGRLGAVSEWELRHWLSEVAWARLLKVINGHLARHGRPEQSYQVFGGPNFSHSQVIVLSPPMLQAIQACADIPPRGHPFIPTDAWDPVPAGPVTAARQRLCDELEAAGFFDGLDSTVALDLKLRVQHSGYGAMFRHPWRCFDADDEAIAEGGAAEFLALWSSALQQLDVPPLTGELQLLDDGTQRLEFPNCAADAVVLFEPRDAQARAAGSPASQAWGLVPGRLQWAINRHLAAHGRFDRFCSVFAGNDAKVMVLTPQMMRAVNGCDEIPRAERPYTRTEDPPGFGIASA